MKKYKKSVMKITLMLLAIILLALITGIVFHCISRGNYLIYTGICFAYVFIIFIPKLTPMYKHTFTLDNENNILEFRQKMSNIKISAEDITEIKYTGTKLMPMFESLSIKTIYKKQTIVIDFYYENNIEIWKQTVMFIKEKRNDLTIPDELLKRLSI